MKFNEFQKAWAEAAELEVKIVNGQLRISHEGKTLGQGDTPLDAVLNAFSQRRKVAETLQTELCALAALGKNPEGLVEDFMELFTEEAEEGDEDDDDLMVED